MAKILIVEDDLALRRELETLLIHAGHEVFSLSEFSELPDKIQEAGAELVLLDINLPEEDGEEVLKSLREVSDTPVIMLTSRSREMDEVLCMSLGADDYITKPYHPTILLLRITAVLRRSAKTPAAKNYRGVQVQQMRGSLVRGENEQILTRNEMIIFQSLLDRQGEIVSRDDLMTALWDREEFVNDSALTTNISRLRAKLALLGLPDTIETRKKQGYLLR